MEKVYGFRTIIPIEKILKPWEKDGKTWYPFTVKGLYKSDGKHKIFNCSEPIPEKCVAMECTCTMYNNVLQFNKFKPK